MATMTLNIQAAVDNPRPTGMAIAGTGCSATSGANAPIFFISSAQEVTNGLTLYTDAALTTPFTGATDAIYRGTSSTTVGTVPLNIAGVTPYVFQVSSSGIVSNRTEC